MHTLGTVLKKIRGDYSQDAFALLLGVSQPTLSLWENKSVRPHSNALHRLKIEALKIAETNSVKLSKAEKEVFNNDYHRSTEKRRGSNANHKPIPRRM